MLTILGVIVGSGITFYIMNERIKELKELYAKSLEQVNPFEKETENEVYVVRDEEEIEEENEFEQLRHMYRERNE